MPAGAVAELAPEVPAPAGDVPAAAERASVAIAGGDGGDAGERPEVMDQGGGDGDGAGGLGGEERKGNHRPPPEEAGSGERGSERQRRERGDPREPPVAHEARAHDVLNPQPPDVVRAHQVLDPQLRPRDGHPRERQHPQPDRDRHERPVERVAGRRVTGPPRRGRRQGEEPGHDDPQRDPQRPRRPSHRHELELPAGSDADERAHPQRRHPAPREIQHRRRVEPGEGGADCRPPGRHWIRAPGEGQRRRRARWRRRPRGEGRSGRRWRRGGREGRSEDTMAESGALPGPHRAPRTRPGRTCGGGSPSVARSLQSPPCRRPPRFGFSILNMRAMSGRGGRRGGAAGENEARPSPAGRYRVPPQRASGDVGRAALRPSHGARRTAQTKAAPRLARRAPPPTHRDLTLPGHVADHLRQGREGACARDRVEPEVVHLPRRQPGDGAARLRARPPPASSPRPR